MNVTMRQNASKPKISMPLLGGLIMAGLFVTFLWKQGWLPIQFRQAPTGTIAENDGPPEPPLADVEVDPIYFNDQSEPTDDSFADVPTRRRGDAGGTSPFNEEWAGDPEAPEMPSRFPIVESRTAPNAPETTSGDTGDIVQVSGSEPPASPAAATPRRGGFPVSPEIEAVDRLIEEGDEIGAHRELSVLYWNKPDMRKSIERRLEQLAKSIYFAPQPHYMRPYTVEPGDNLEKIAKLYKVPWKYLAALNDISNPAKIRPGQQLKVIKGPFNAFVDLSDHELTIHAHGYYVRRYKVGIGKDGATPIGRFKVLDKVTDPQYTDPRTGRVIAADDPANPLGGYWIDIGNSYGIHGTIDPKSVGQAESRGCIRMLDRDIKEVYNLLTVGSEVVIRR
jgi:lipoprotein-anchoring transpeptidase ErfK/SrfK